MSKSSTSSVYVGPDVHKDGIDIAVAEAGRDGEVQHVGSSGGDLVALDKALRKLNSKDAPLHNVYEAGPWASSSGASASKPCCCTTESPAPERAPWTAAHLPCPAAPKMAHGAQQIGIVRSLPC